MAAAHPHLFRQETDDCTVYGVARWKSYTILWNRCTICVVGVDIQQVFRGKKVAMHAAIAMELAMARATTANALGRRTAKK